METNYIIQFTWQAFYFQYIFQIIAFNDAQTINVNMLEMLFGKKKNKKNSDLGLHFSSSSFAFNV